MYYSRNIILAKLHSKKLWLYKEGEEFSEITGGWIANGTSTKTINTLKVKGQDANIVSTFSPIELKNGERLFMTVKSIVSPGGGRWSFYVGYPSILSNRLLNSKSSLTTLSINDYLPLNIPTTLFFYNSASILGQIAISTNFGTLEISEVWIEKYEN